MGVFFHSKHFNGIQSIFKKEGFFYDNAPTPPKE
jgi:hypothetical protein